MTSDRDRGEEGETHSAHLRACDGGVGAIHRDCS